MDRQTIYSGQVPRTTDLLQSQQNAMVALAELSATVFGTPTLVDAFTVTPTTPATLNVLLTPGNIYQLEDLEATTWSSLPANTASSILKQGIQFSDAGTLLGVGNPATITITPPGTLGYSQIYLIEVQYQDVDGGSLVLPYYNASNPSVPFSGPGDAGTAQNTVRYGAVAYQAKAGVAAPSGSEVAPTPDAGWTGLFYVTVAFGQSTITAGNITEYPEAPFLATNGHLPQIPTGVQENTWTYAADTSAGGTPPSTSASTTTASAVLTFSSVPSWVAVGMVAYDVTTPTAITGGQTVSSKTSTTVTLSGNVNATVNSGDQIAFSNNAMVASVAPAPPALMPGLSVVVKAAGTNSAASPTLNLNGLGAVAIHRANGSAAQPGDIPANEMMRVVYDGSAWQIQNFTGIGSSGTTNNNTFVLTIPYAVDSGTVNAVVGPFSPAVTSLFAGLTVEVKIANTNTGAATLQCNSLTAEPIVNADGSALGANQLVAGMVALFIYNGTAFEFIGAVSASSAVSTGKYIRRWTAPELTSFISITATFEPTGNAPQNNPMTFTEGQQVFSLTVTPQSAASQFHLNFSSTFATYDTITSYVVYISIWRQDGTLVATTWHGLGAAWSNVVTCNGIDSPNTTSPVTYSVRVAGWGGPTAGVMADPIDMNGRPPCQVGYNDAPGGTVATFWADEIHS